MVTMSGSAQEADVSLGSEHIRILNGINFGFSTFDDNNDIITPI